MMLEEQREGQYRDIQRSGGVDDSIDLFELFTLIAVQWRRVLAVAAGLFLLGVIIIYSITPLFEASASLMPQTHQASSSLASLLGSNTSGEVLVGLLKSRSVADEVIDRVDLMRWYNLKSRQQARKLLASRSDFKVQKDTLVLLQVRDKSAETAAKIADAYLMAMDTQRAGMLKHDDEIQGKFFGEQLRNESEALSNAEDALEAAQVRTGVVQPEAQTVIGLTSIASIRSEIARLEVQLASLKLGASNENPRVQQLESQIAVLRSEERARESASGNAGSGAAASARNMPELNINVERKQREVKFHEVLLTSIATHYETARLSSGISGEPYSIVDRAVVPETKAWPPRLLLLILDMFVSLFLGLCVAAGTLLLRRLRTDPAQTERIATLRESFRFTR